MDHTFFSRAFNPLSASPTNAHHHLIATVLKTTYERFPPKLLTYRSYEHSWNDSLKNKFKSEDLRNSVWRYWISEIFNYKKFKYGNSFRKRIVRGNNKPHITSLVRNHDKVKIKNNTNKSGKEQDLKAYKNEIYNHFHNILRLFDVLPFF